MKNTKKLSLLSLSAVAMTMGSTIPSYGQVISAETLENLNLRSGPSTNHSIVLTIKRGNQVEVVENLGLWTLVKYKNNIGYVSSQYIKQIKPNTDSSSNTTKPSEYKLMECNTSILNVRKGPSTSDSILGKINKTDRVYVLYTTNTGWARIKYGSGYGYVSSQYLSEIKSSEKPSINLESTMYCNTNSLNVRKGASTSEKIIGSLKYKEKVIVIGSSNNNWSKIKFNNSYAYVSSQYLSKSISNNTSDHVDDNNQNKATFMTCNSDFLNIRKGPSPQEKITGVLKKGDKVEVAYHLNSGWSRIKINNTYAYVSTYYLV